MDKKQAISIVESLPSLYPSMQDFEKEAIWELLDIVNNATSNNDDLISRQMAIKEFEKHCYPVRYNRNSIEKGMTITGIRQVLNELSSVQSKQRVGEWIPVDIDDEDEWGLWKCSYCGAELWSMAFDLNGFYDFCPKCGKKKWRDNNA